MLKRHFFSQATYVYVNGKKLVNFSQRQEFTLSLIQAGTTFQEDQLKTKEKSILKLLA